MAHQPLATYCCMAHQPPRDILLYGPPAPRYILLYGPPAPRYILLYGLPVSALSGQVLPADRQLPVLGQLSGGPLRPQLVLPQPGSRLLTAASRQLLLPLAGDPRLPPALTVSSAAGGGGPLALAL